jgi:hypothetical protein
MAIKEKTQREGGSRRDSHQNAAERKSGDHHPPTSVQPVEPEDAKQTGGDPHLQKRVLAENVEGGALEQHPESPAGQHATGSFTGKASKNSSGTKR